MPEKNKKFYVTTSIAYTNAPPHIGFALEAIETDVTARYHRFLEKNVFFLTGTDEHGAKITKAAEKEGKTPKEFVDGISEQFRKLKGVLNLSNDDFIRTTDEKRHFPAVKKVWSKLKENGDIYKKNYQGLYCIGCEAFITKKDLINGKCIIHQKEPDVVEEENYFFRLSKYSKKIEEIIKKDEIKIIPEARKNEILSFIRQGLEDISFSRPRKDLEWGIPVPEDSSQTIYVWADALTNYLSAIGYESDSKKFKKYWPVDVHFIGKDILKFHGAIWPGMILSLGLELPKKIFVHGFITSAGQKMSKSLGNIINPFELVRKYGTDAVRYYLLREIPATEDGDFTYEKFKERYNADLAGGLGNLVARVIVVADRINLKLFLKVGSSKIKELIDKTRENYKNSLEELKFNEALIAIWNLIHSCDEYIDKEKPWEESKDQKEIVNDLLFAIDNIAELLKPILPETSEKIVKQLKTLKSQSLFPRLN